MHSDLLDHIEKSNDSVDTTQLLDLLERETHQSGPLSSSVSVIRPPAVNNVATSGDDDVIAVEKQSMSNGNSKKQTPPRRRRTQRSGYNSGDSHDSSLLHINFVGGECFAQLAGR